MVSIIMSVYNTEEEYLRQAIESILEQTYSDFEFIIICDCPSDNSEQIVTEYANKDSRIVVLRNEKNIGVAKSLNKGIEVAKGDLIARMDADDISHKCRLEKQVDFFRKHLETDVLFIRTQIIDEKGRKSGKRGRFLRRSSIIPSLFVGCMVHHPSVMLRKKIIENLDYVYNPLSKAEDYDLWMRLASQGATFAQIKGKYFQYRVHSNQVTKTNNVLINESALDSLHSFIVSNGIEASKEEVKEYIVMMNSFEKMNEKSYLKSRKILKAIINCELVQKNNASYLYWRERIRSIQRFINS